METLSRVEHDQTLSRVQHTTKLILGSNTRPNSLSGRTHDQTLSRVEHTTKLSLGSNTRPNSLSGRAHDQTTSSPTTTTSCATGRRSRSSSSWRGILFYAPCLFFVALCCTSTRLLPLCGVQFLLFLCLCFTPVTGPLIYMFTTCFAKFCHLCVTLYCRPARLCASYLRNNLVVCSTREEVCSCVRAEKELFLSLKLLVLY